MSTTPKPVPMLIPVKSPALTDMGNAERLTFHHGDSLHYCYAHRRWYVWNRQRWAADEGGSAEALAKDAARRVYAEAVQAPDGERKTIGRWANTSQGAARIKAMIDLARSERGIPIRPDELDVDPWLLTCENVTLRLEQKGLFPKVEQHERKNLCTRAIHVEYNPNATAPLWTKFLERVLPDIRVRQFVQKAAGSCLTGIV